MFYFKLLLLACLTFSAKALEITDECCSGMSASLYSERLREMPYLQKAIKLVKAKPAVEYVTESAPLDMVEEEYEELKTLPLPPPTPPTHATPAPLPPKITIEITQTPQPVTEPTPAPSPAHYEAPAADPCRETDGCWKSKPQAKLVLEPIEEQAYLEEREYIPVRSERVMQFVKPVQYVTAYEEPRQEIVEFVQPQRLEVIPAAPCSKVCHASLGCCQ